MTLRNLAAAAALGLWLAGCGPAGDDRSAETNAAANAAAAEPELKSAETRADVAACPFRRTRDWVGSVERGHVRINGTVDVQMAGFRPTLTERPGTGGGALALDLAFAPAPGEPINDHVRFERTGAPPYRQAEIWCGGEVIERIDMTVVQ
jgi:hypothetical protein